MEQQRQLVVLLRENGAFCGICHDKARKPLDKWLCRYHGAFTHVVDLCEVDTCEASAANGWEGLPWLDQPLVINLTSHPIDLLTQDGVTVTLEQAMVPARAEQTVVESATIVVDGHPFPVVETTYGDPVGLPDYREYVLLVVSTLTAQAAKAAGRRTDDLMIPSRIIRRSDGTVVGAKALSRFL